MQRFSWAALAAVMVLAITSISNAQETTLLGGTGEASVQSLLFDGRADTEQVFYRGWGGYRGWGWGGWGWRGWGYRPWGWYAGYRPFFGYRSYYGYAPYLYSYYTPSYYYAPSYYAAPAYSYPDYSYYVNPCSVDTPSMPNAVVLGSSSYVQPSVFQTPAKKPAVALRPPVARPSDDGTYFYDGGPAQPMPLPGQDSAPAIEKRPSVPLEGRLVSIPSQPRKYSYPAYGESTPAQAVQTTLPRLATSPAITTRVGYRAYGER